MTTTTPSLAAQLDYLKLGQVAEHHATLAQEAAAAAWSHLEFLQRLLNGECAVRQQRAVERRVRAARFPVIKTLDQFHWDWPKNINKLQVQHLFRLGFVTQSKRRRECHVARGTAQKTNVIFVGSVGTGKTHLASALGYTACQQGHSVLLTTAIDNLVAAQAAHRLKAELNRYLSNGRRSSTTTPASPPTSTILDRLLHQAETVVIYGKSYRMMDQIEPPN